MLDGVAERVLAWSKRQGRRVGAIVVVAVGTVRSSVEDRVTGLAAEMAFFALLSLIPLLVAVGAVLGVMGEVVGDDAVERVHRAIIVALQTVFTSDVVATGIGPLVEGLLTRPRGGVALSGLLVALYLASRVFAAVIRALDQAYGIEERRSLLTQRLLAIGFAVGAVVLTCLGLLVLVIGPLLGLGQVLAEAAGIEGVATQAWRLGRFPVFALLTVGGFCVLYRLAPNRRSTWRNVLPGAVTGVGLFFLLTTGLRVYLQAGGSVIGAAALNPDEAVAGLLAALGAVAAVVVWVWLSGLALLVGGELNAEWERYRLERRHDDVVAA